MFMLMLLAGGVQDHGQEHVLLAQATRERAVLVPFTSFTKKNPRNERNSNSRLLYCMAQKKQKERD
jgi:hypothetical protein